jgi:hypothetical protein
MRCGIPRNSAKFLGNFARNTEETEVPKRKEFRVTEFRGHPTRDGESHFCLMNSVVPFHSLASF